MKWWEILIGIAAWIIGLLLWSAISNFRKRNRF